MHRFNSELAERDCPKLVPVRANLGSISAVSRVRSLILPEEEAQFNTALCSFVRLK